MNWPIYSEKTVNNQAENMNTKSLFLPVLLLSVILQGCSDKTDKTAYVSEAKAVCETFNPGHWKNLPPNLQPYQIQEMHAERLSAAIKSKEMREIIGNIPKVKPGSGYQ